AIGLPGTWVTPLLANSGWRLLLFLGAVPALLTFFIRLFVPESERWQQEQKRGTTSSWAARDLVGVGIGAVGAGAIIYLWTVEHPPQLVGAEYDWIDRIAGSLVA